MGPSPRSGGGHTGHHLPSYGHQGRVARTGEAAARAAAPAGHAVELHFHGVRTNWNRGFTALCRRRASAARASSEDLRIASITNTAQEAGRRPVIMSLPAKTLPEVLQHAPGAGSPECMADPRLTFTADG